jgi:hypothetical protein
MRSRPTFAARLLPAAALALLLGAVAAPAAAQSDAIRPVVESARLGSGYAQIVTLASTPDISAASYDLDSGPTLDVFRLPYQARWLSLSPDADLYWRIAGGYLQLKQDLPVDLGSQGQGSVNSKWSAYSATGGLLAKIRFGRGFTFEPALDIGVGRLDNDASYEGAASALRPLLDGLLFNWRTDAWLATPSVALAWDQDESDRRIRVRGHVARTWIASFDESDPVLEFDETANVYSIRASDAAPTGTSLLGRPLDGVIFGGYRASSAPIGTP